MQMTSKGRFLRLLIGGAAGAVVFPLLTQLYVLTGATCTSLCRLEVGVPFGVFGGLLAAHLLEEEWRYRQASRER